MNFFEQVYKILCTVPKGRVTTYGDIAKALGKPRMARQVGWALHTNPMPGIIPCHRVVNRNGNLSGAFAFGGIDAQKQLLQSEGVVVQNNRVDLTEYRFKF